MQVLRHFYCASYTTETVDDRSTLAEGSRGASLEDDDISKIIDGKDGEGWTI